MTTDPKIVRCLSWRAVSSSPQSEKESLSDQQRQNATFVDNLHVYYPGYHGVLVSELEFVGSRDIMIDEALEFEPYRRLVQAIRGHEVDAIVCRSRDRLGRDLSLVSYFDSLCRRNGVVIVPRESNRPFTLDADELNRNFGHSIVAAVDSSLGQAHLRQFVNLSRMGVQDRVMNRKLFRAKPPYGYVMKDGVIVIDPSKSVHILKGIEMYLEGKGTRVIGIYMNDHGVPSPAGGKWSETTFNEILHDHVHSYAGKLLVNRRSLYVREPSLIDGSHPPIIDAETYATLLLHMKRRASVPVHDPHLLTGVALCSVCGGVLVYAGYGKPYGDGRSHIMRCGRGKCDPRVSVMEHRVVIALEQIFEHMVSQISLEDFLATHVVQDDQSEVRSSIERHTVLLEAERKKKDRLIDLYASGVIASKSDLSSKLVALDDSIRSIQVALLELNERINETNLNSPENMARIYYELKRGLLHSIRNLSGDVEASNRLLSSYVRVYIKNGTRWDNRIDEVVFGDFSRGSAPED